VSVDWETAAQIATVVIATIAFVAFIRGSQYLSQRQAASRPLAARAYECTERAIELLSQDQLHKAVTQDSWETDTAPVIDKAEATLGRIKIEGRWAVRRKARKLLAKLTETRSKAFAMVDLIKSKADGKSKEKALKQYEVLYQELVRVLGKYEKAARR
jgi:hypothetical protein